MSGQLWALIAGVGFGTFQASNRRAAQRLDVYLSTFLQLIVSAVVLAIKRVTARIWLGAAVIVGGSVLLVFTH